MSRGSWRNKLVEERLINQIDRRAQQGPAKNDFEEGQRMRLHEAKQGMWVREIKQGAGNFGPPLRVVDPKGGVLENRKGRIFRLPPRTQILVETEM